jgi:hypothetical protein
VIVSGSCKNKAIWLFDQRNDTYVETSRKWQGTQSLGELTEQEMEQVSGGFTFLPRCTFDPVTCAMDGVCSPPPAC